jgi:hypothetical protein
MNGQRHHSPDDRLGMSEAISRRDFVNGAPAGASLLVHGKAAEFSPADAFNGYGGIGDYAHSNGNTWEVLSAGHVMRDGAFEKRIANATLQRTPHCDTNAAYADQPRDHAHPTRKPPCGARAITASNCAKKLERPIWRETDGSNILR